MSTAVAVLCLAYAQHGLRRTAGCAP